MKCLVIEQDQNGLPLIVPEGKQFVMTAEHDGLLIKVDGKN